jgi:hypothetical protein
MNLNGAPFRLFLRLEPLIICVEMIHKSQKKCIYLYRHREILYVFSIKNLCFICKKLSINWASILLGDAQQIFGKNTLQFVMKIYQNCRKKGRFFLARMGHRCNNIYRGFKVACFSYGDNVIHCENFRDIGRQQQSKQ